jgi:hypothetical protein
MPRALAVRRDVIVRGPFYGRVFRRTWDKDGNQLCGEPPPAGSSAARALDVIAPWVGDLTYSRARNKFPPVGRR